ncbi:MAG: hypothetical protein U1F16_09500 [Turneriella sp.]
MRLTRDEQKSPSLSRGSKYLFFSNWPFGDMKRSRIRSDLRAGSTIEDFAARAQAIKKPLLFLAVKITQNTISYIPHRPGSKGGWDIYQTRYENDVRLKLNRARQRKHRRQ